MAANELLVSRGYTGQHASADAPQQAAPEAPVAKTRRRLFTKYVALFVAVVCIALVSNGVFDVLFYYQEHKASLIRIQREQAEAAAAKIGQFIKEIESQLGWTTQLPWSAGSIETKGTRQVGIVVVAAFAASAAGGLPAQITATLARTSSLANAGNRPT
jgi:hypothetical protein